MIRAAGRSQATIAKGSIRDLAASTVRLAARLVAFIYVGTRERGRPGIRREPWFGRDCMTPLFDALARRKSICGR
jgi:hypothetical protein